MPCFVAKHFLSLTIYPLNTLQLNDGSFTASSRIKFQVRVSPHLIQRFTSPLFLFIFWWLSWDLIWNKFCVVSAHTTFHSAPIVVGYGLLRTHCVIYWFIKINFALLTFPTYHCLHNFFLFYKKWMSQLLPINSYDLFKY